MDALSAALEELRLRCVLIDTQTEPVPWRRVFPADAVSLHVVLDGGCLIDSDLEVSRFRLDPGEVLVVNRAVAGELRAISEADPPDVLSARVHLDAPFPHPMLGALPAYIRATVSGVPRSFPPTMHALREELASPVPGARVVAAHLCEVLFVQAVRSHIHRDLAWNAQGYFRMLADPLLREHLDRASRPGAPLDVLSGEHGRRRQRTRARFARLGGTTPAAFVRKARVRRAAELLRMGEADLDRVARESGFASRQTLRRAFRRELGVTPAAHWRSLHHRPFPQRTPPAGRSA